MGRCGVALRGSEGLEGSEARAWTAQGGAGGHGTGLGGSWVTGGQGLRSRRPGRLEHGPSRSSRAGGRSADVCGADKEHPQEGG